MAGLALVERRELSAQQDSRPLLSSNNSPTPPNLRDTATHVLQGDAESWLAHEAGAQSGHVQLKR
jgi:hypothetical protein